MASEILAMGMPVRIICATEEWMGKSEVSNLDAPNTEYTYLVSDEQLARLSTLRKPNKVWMLLERSACNNRSLKLKNSNLTLVLDRVQDPGNMGTIIRTADWFGIRHVVCSTDTVSCFNPKVVQSTMGSLFRVEVGYCNLQEWLKDCGMPIYGAVLDGASLQKTDLTRPAVLVIGNESRGISPEIRSLLTQRIAIPNIGGTCESLNAAVATAILVSKFVM